MRRNEDGEPFSDVASPIRVARAASASQKAATEAAMTPVARSTRITYRAITAPKNAQQTTMLELIGTEEQPRVSSMDRDLSERIRERAYEIWMATGCRHGQAEQHWVTAEHEILTAPSLAAKAADAPSKANKRRGNAKRSKESLRQ
jgi:hypothetical protein